MKSKAYALTGALAAMGLFWACSSEEPCVSDNQKIIQAHARIAGQATSRAIPLGDGTSTTDGFDLPLDIWVFGISVPNSSFADFTNATASFTTIVQDRSVNTKLSYSETNPDNISMLTAVYPAPTSPTLAHASVLSANTLDYTIDGFTDILCADTLNAGSFNNIPLLLQMDFRHMQAQMVVNIVTDDSLQTETDWGKITGISLLDMPNQAQLTLPTSSVKHGVLTAIPTSSKVKLPFTLQDSNNPALDFVVPATAAKFAGNVMFIPGDSQVAITVDSEHHTSASTMVKSAYFTKQGGATFTSFEAGYTYVVTLNISKSHIRLDGTSAIANWTEVQGGTIPF